MKNMRNFIHPGKISINALVLYWIFSFFLSSTYIITLLPLGLPIIIKISNTLGNGFVIGVIFLIVIIIMVPIFHITKNVTMHRMSEYGRKYVYFIVLCALLFSMSIVLNAPKGIFSSYISRVQELSRLYQRIIFTEEEVTLNILPDEKHGSDGNTVEIRSISSEVGEISYQALEYQNGWNREGNRLITQDSIPSAISWRGFPGNYLRIEFLSSPDSGIVEISWEHKSVSLDLHNDPGKIINVYLNFSNEVKPLILTLFILSTIFQIAFFALLFLLFLLSKKPYDKLEKIFIPIIFLIYIIVGTHIYTDYGIWTDAVAQRRHGLVSLKHVILKFDPDFDSPILSDRPDLDNYRSKYYGVAMTLPLGLIEVVVNNFDKREVWHLRHLLTFLFYYFGASALYKLISEKFSNWRIGILGFLFFVLSPFLFVDSFVNVKDTAFLAATNISLLFGYRYWTQKTTRSAVLFGISAAFATNIRVVMILLFFIIMVWIIFLRGKESWHMIHKHAIVVVTFVIFSILFMPASWSNPLLTYFNSLTTFSDYTRWDDEFLFRGMVIQGQNPPIDYIPVSFAVTTPLIYLIFIVIGFLSTLMRGIRNIKIRDKFLILDEDLLFIGLSSIPLLIAILLNSTLYSSWRHFFFTYSFLIVILINGVEFVSKDLVTMIDKNIRKWIKISLVASFIMTFIWISIWMVRNHPFQYAYYDSVVVSLFGGRDKFNTYNTRMSLLQGIRHILETDEAEEISIFTQNATSIPIEEILVPEERDRIKRVGGEFQYPDYYINTYRYPWVSYPYEKYEQYFTIEVDNNPILSIFRHPE